MGDVEALRQFVHRLSPLVGLAYDWISSLPSRENAPETGLGADAIAERSNRFIGAANICMPELLAMDRHETDTTRWEVRHGVWRYGGKIGEEPKRPVWPHSLPEFTIVNSILRRVNGLLRCATSPSWGIVYGSAILELAGLIDGLDEAQEIIDKPPDQRISRKQLAELVGVAEKTLKNRVKELPTPIGLDDSNTPLYEYEAARKAASQMFPGKAFMLPARWNGERNIRQDV